MMRNALGIAVCATLAALAGCRTGSPAASGPPGSLPIELPAGERGESWPPHIASEVPPGTPIDEMPLPEGEFTFAGGDGTSLEQAVIVNAPNEQVGVAAVYGWIGRRHPKSTAAAQETVIRHGRYFDAIEIVTPRQERLKFYFDVTQFFGKFQSQ